MKKFISFVLFVSFVFSLVGCMASGAPSTTESQILPQEESLTVGLVCLHDENSPYDNNFITAFESACEKADVNYLIKTNIDESGVCADAACELADSGCALVFADSFGHEDYIIQAAMEFPEVEFCHATGVKAHTENLPNYHNAFASIYEGRFLDGVVAGMKLNEMIESGEIGEDEALVGYVGAFQYAEVISGYSSFYLGVKYECPSAKMLVRFTNSWYDETLEKEAANQLIESGCKVISGHADSMGLPNACEQAGVPFVFYNGDVSLACPNSYMVSTRINWEPYFEYIINCVKNHEPIDVDWTGTLVSNSVVMTAVNENVAPAGAQERINEVTALLVSGELEVFDSKTFTVGGEEVTSYLADVDFDESYAGDTEAIVKGAFEESSFRSAPYFDLTIDGITLQ